MRRADIDNLKTILLAIEKVERTARPGSVMAAEQLDCLYMALKAQAKSVCEIQQMEEVDNEAIN